MGNLNFLVRHEVELFEIKGDFFLPNSQNESNFIFRLEKLAMKFGRIAFTFKKYKIY
jgi:hypothetical protein